MEIQLKNIEKQMKNISSTLPEAELKSEENVSRDEDLKKLEDRIQDLESNVLQMEINNQMLLDLAETVNVADLKSMISTTGTQNDMIERASQFLNENNASMEEIEYEMNAMKELLNEIIDWDLRVTRYGITIEKRWNPV